jgi:hypothetical protein
MNRKKFITSLSVASVGAAVFNSYPTFKVAKTSYRIDEPSVIKPPRLKAGDKLAIVAPGSYISEEELQDSIKNLNQLGFETTYSEKVFCNLDILQASDKDRAEDLWKNFLIKM